MIKVSLNFVAEYTYGKVHKRYITVCKDETEALRIIREIRELYNITDIVGIVWSSFTVEHTKVENLRDFAQKLHRECKE